MKIFYSILFIVFITKFSLIAGGPEYGTVVSTFYLTFPPAYQESDADSLKAGVLISSFSNYETNIAITINSRNYRKEITLAPFASEEVFFDIADAFPVQRKKTDTIAYENVFPSSAIKVEADNEVSCYGLVKSKKINEGFLVYPLEALNLQYIVSTIYSRNKNYPTYTAIVGTYDNTKVTFRMGGCGNCKTITDYGYVLNQGEVIRRNINEGDVWLVPGIGDYNDLSGSIIVSSKPVAVISGNYYGRVLDNSQNYNYIIEQDVPTNLYGNKFYIDNIKGSTKSPLLAIYPKNPATIIYANGKPIDTLITPGGAVKDGFTYYIPYGEFKPPVVISSDSAHPINVVVFNNNEGDYPFPFKMQMVPEERYSESTGFQFPTFDKFKYNSNLIYKPFQGGVPEDFRVTEFDKNTMFDSSFVDFFDVDMGRAFPKIDDNQYYSRIINFEGNDKFAFYNNEPFVNYIYGGNGNSAFGFPTKIDFRVKNGSDTIAPSVIISNDCCCGNSIYGTVQDVLVPENEKSANLIKIFMDKNSSYNFNFSFNNFILGAFDKINWQLKAIDPTKDAFANLMFIDRSGNIREEKVEYKARKIDILDTLIDFGKSLVGDTTKENIRLFTIKNNSTFDYLSQFYSIYPILYSTYNNQESNFELLSVQDFAPLMINQEKSFEVKFKNKQFGQLKDSLGILLISYNTQDTCQVKFFAELTANSYQAYVQTDGVDFGEQNIGGIYSTKTLTIQNPIDPPYKSELPIKIVGYEVIGDSIGNFNSDRAFRILGIDKISDSNPIVLAVGDKYEFVVSFHPDSERTYYSNISFKVKTDLSQIFVQEPDNDGLIYGIGKVSTSVLEELIEDDIAISPNPAGEYITLNLYGINPTLKRGVEGDVLVEIYDVMGVKIQTDLIHPMFPKHRMYVGNLAPGVYFVKIGGSNGACSIVKKFVKM